MHRTRTAAALLITLTASAVSGCVSVGGPATAPHTRPAAEPQPTPQARGGSEPKLVTAPAHEALRMMRPTAPKSTGSLRTPEQPKRDGAPSSSDRGTGAAQSGKQRHADGTDQSGLVGGSRLPGAVPPKSLLPGGDVCGLGERYGQWGPDSPQARICRAQYGS